MPLGRISYSHPQGGARVTKQENSPAGNGAPWIIDVKLNLI